VEIQLLERLSRRFLSERLTAEGDGGHNVQQALNDLNHQLRYALGEYDSPPSSFRAL
jgi:hypothetical protein